MVARSFVLVGRSFKSLAKTLFQSFVHGKKNDLTHQTNVFATPINDFATFLVARSYICVAKS